jgi:hypothetical protein
VRKATFLIEEGHFQWLYTEEILDEYKEILKRLNVRPSVPVGAGTFVFCIASFALPAKSTASQPELATRKEPSWINRWEKTRRFGNMRQGERRC